MRRMRRNPGVATTMVAMEAAKRTPAWAVPAALFAAGAAVWYFVFRGGSKKIVEAGGEAARQMLIETKKTVESFLEVVWMPLADWMGIRSSIEEAERKKEAEQMVTVIKTWEDGMGGVRDVYARLAKRSPVYIVADEAFFLVQYAARSDEASGKNFNPETIGIAKGTLAQVNARKLPVINAKDLQLKAIIDRDKKGTAPTAAERKWMFDEINATEEGIKSGRYAIYGYRRSYLSAEAAGVAGAFLKELRDRLAAEEKAKAETRRVLKPIPKKS